MGYKEINDTWKQFLNEQTFKEKKPKIKKEIIDSGNESEDQGYEMDECSASHEEEESLEEMSSMGSGAVEGFAGPIGNSPTKKKKRLK